jgi:hypothetical protein
MEPITSLDQALQVIEELTNQLERQEITIKGLVDFAVSKGLLKRKATPIPLVSDPPTRPYQIIDLDERRRLRYGEPPF